MDFTLIDPPIPSFADWRRLRAKGRDLTILRAMEYDILDQIQITGRVLDFGGGRKADYAPVFPPETSVSSVNIDAEFDPTHIVAPGAPLPFEEASFDTVLTFNTLEHIFDDIGALTELARVMKPGAVLHITVPFLYRVHGHPDDYNRHTPSWWQHALAQCGFRRATLLPLVFGRATAGQLITGRGDKLVRPLTAEWAAMKDILSAKIRMRGHSHYTGRRGERVWHCAPGWYICATR